MHWINTFPQPPQEVTVYNLVSVGAGLVLWETHAQHECQVMNVTSYQHLSLLLNSTSIASFQGLPCFSSLVVLHFK